MGFSLVYLGHRLLYRIYAFFHGWYVHGSRFFFRSFFGVIRGLDRDWAVRQTLYHFFEPLYGDYSWPGRFWAIIFRPLRIVIAIVLYVVATIGYACVYATWLLVPPALLILSLLSFIPDGNLSR
jgi:hypothetical protein